MMSRGKLQWCVMVAGMVLSVYGTIGFLQADPVEMKTESAKIKLLNGPEYLPVVLSCLENAKEKIWISMYVMGYKKDIPGSAESRLIEQLRRQHRRGVDVRVILDAGLEWNPKTRKMDGNRSQKNDEAFAWLKAQGIPVRFDSLDQITHAKVVIVDGDLLVVGSTNWTYSALKKNVETSVLIQSAQHNQEMADYYEKLWQACESDQISNGIERK